MLCTRSAATTCVPAKRSGVEPCSGRLRSGEGLAKESRPLLVGPGPVGSSGTLRWRTGLCALRRTPLRRSSHSGDSAKFGFTILHEMPPGARHFRLRACAGRGFFMNITGIWPCLHKTLSGAGRWNRANFALTEFYEVRQESFKYRSLGDVSRTECLLVWRRSATRWAGEFRPLSKGGSVYEAGVSEEACLLS